MAEALLEPLGDVGGRPQGQQVDDLVVVQVVTVVDQALHQQAGLVWMAVATVETFFA